MPYQKAKKRYDRSGPSKGVQSGSGRLPQVIVKLRADVMGENAFEAAIFICNTFRGIDIEGRKLRGRQLPDIKTRVECAKLVLAYGWGLPTQRIKLDASNDERLLETLDAIATREVAAVVSAMAPPPPAQPVPALPPPTNGRHRNQNGVH